MKKKIEISLKDLLEAGCHFGHQSRRWHPKMQPYLYGAREGVHIFDLVKTKEGLEAAATFARDTAAKGGKIVFVGSKRQAKDIIIEEAKGAGMPYVAERWLGGIMTNWEQIKKSVDKLKDLKTKKAIGEFKKYTKKENLLIDREIVKLERFVGGLVDLTQLPEALFIVDIKKEAAAVAEALQKEIPTIAIVDSNCDPTPIDFVIPANDDATGSIKFIVQTIAQAIKEGKEKWSKSQRT